MNRIIFVFPRRHIGGVQTLFLRLANEIAKFATVAIVDYRDGYISRNVVRSVELIEYKDGCEINIPENSTVVLEADCVFNDSYMFKYSKGTKLFFWKLHPLNLHLGYLNKKNQIFHLGFLPINYLVKPSHKLLSLVVDNNALYHMDGATIDSTRDITGRNDHFPLLPLYFNESNMLRFVSSNNECAIKLVWLGRLEVGFKTIPLVKLLEDLSRLPLTKNVTFTVIGSGNGEGLIREVSQRLENVNIYFKGMLEGDKLKKCLLEHDIAFAMGTSSLHTASLGLPTVLLDCSFTAMPDKYLYRWVFETKDFSLGYVVSPLTPIPNENTHTIQEIIEEPNLDNCSRLCKGYVDNVYSKNSSEFFKVFQSTNLYLDDFLRARSLYKSTSIIYKFRKLRSTISEIAILRFLWFKIKYIFDKMSE